MGNHILYEKNDFKGQSLDDSNKWILFDAVVNGGLAVCKICGEFEAGLDNACNPKTTPSNETSGK